MLDRQLQRTLLEQMAEVYPLSWDMAGVLGQVDELVLQANLAYLAEHGLITDALLIGVDRSVAFSAPTITAHGMDFLEDDGGLTAILGVVTIKIHDETVRKLLDQHIAGLHGSDDEKSMLRRTVDGLLPTAGKAVLERLIGLGVNHLPGTVDALHAWLVRAM